MFKGWYKIVFILLMVSLLVASVIGCNKNAANPVPQPQKQQNLGEQPQFANKELILATTTSTNDTGLLDVLIPKFEELTGLRVKVISVGTGQAMELGRNGDVDVVLVHSRSAEDQFVAEGYGVNRRDVMYNDFVVLGPESDPAGVRGKTMEEAFQIFASGAVPFVSRGDNSGTYNKEVSVWKSINIEPVGKWYSSIGKGMGDTINTANEMLAYTLADRGTFIKMEKNTDLQIVIEGDKKLLNPYGIISVNPEIHSHVNFEGAEAFAEFITSDEGKSMINGFLLEGKQLFFAN